MMRKSFLSVLLVIIAITTHSQFTELPLSTKALTRHWKNLAVPMKPALLGGKYYTKLDDETFIAIDGTVAGTRKLEGFTNVKSIADYVATSKYLYYSVYTGGKVYLNRYDPVTKTHTAVKNGSKVFAEPDESILVYSTFSKKLIVSCWRYNRSDNNTFTMLYAIHDADTSAASWLLAGSLNQDGILDGRVGLSDDQVIARYNVVKQGAEPRKTVYAFGFKDSLKGYYQVAKTYDFMQIGQVVNSIVGFGKDVLFVLNNKIKMDAKEAASSVWLLRNKSAKNIGQLPTVKSNSLSYVHEAGDLVFLIFPEAVYSFNSGTSVFKNELALQSNESLGLISSNDYLRRCGDTLWFRLGVKGADGNINYSLQYLNMKARQVMKITASFPERFQKSYMFEQPSVNYAYFGGTNIYYFTTGLTNDMELFQLSLVTGKTNKIPLPSTLGNTPSGIVDVVQLGPSLLIKARYKTTKETYLRTFFYRL